MSEQTGETDVLRERIVDALHSEWIAAAEARTVASPREHCEALADVVMAVLASPDPVEPSDSGAC